MSSAKTVCVVIPCYRAELNHSEQAALQRCVAILGAHPVFLVKPAGLSLQALTECYPNLHTESFDDHFFTGVQGYNRLMLCDEFYARFDQYQYLLICQLDAFVFRDELLQWCERGYDYIGAPWLPGSRPPNSWQHIRAVLRRKLYRWINRRDRSGQGAHHAQYDYCAGNGGFSLRRITAMREALRRFNKQAEAYRSLTHHTFNEDIFFSLETNRYRTTVRTPELYEALQFAWESHPALAALLNQHKLPFGCHGWDKLHHDEWRPVFHQAGLSLDRILGTDAATAKTNIKNQQ